MKMTWHETLSSSLIIVAIVLIFARLQSYSWWLLGSWKTAVALLSLIGLGLIVSYIQDIVDSVDFVSFTETFLWIITATVAIASLFVVTTKIEFISLALLMFVSWATQFVRHFWVMAHHNQSKNQRFAS